MLKAKLSALQKGQLTPLKKLFLIHYLSTDSERQGTKDPTQEYDEKEPMSPDKIKQHEPTAVSRDPSDQKIVELGKERVYAEDARGKARRSGMTKGSAGAD